MHLDIEALSVRFPGLPGPVLSIEHLAIASGMKVALTGGSGSGKSTLINAMTGLERVRSGKLCWNGDNLATFSEGARDRWRGSNVGLVMQDFHLFPGLSVLENILLPARLARSSIGPLKARAQDLIRSVGLSRPDQAVETLSRGEMQRAAIARAILRKPSIIIADEPTASLDEASGEAIGDLLLSVAAENKSTLIVATHDPRLMERLDQRITLSKGHLVRTPKEGRAVS